MKIVFEDGPGIDLDEGAQREVAAALTYRANAYRRVASEIANPVTRGVVEKQAETLDNTAAMITMNIKTP
jgi:hypothetical protein